MKFSDFIDLYAGEHDIATGTIVQFTIAVSALNKFAGSTLSLADVTPDLINRHLAEMKTRGLADSTRQSRRRDLLLLLRNAVERGDRPEFDAKRVLKVKVRDRIVRAWTKEQVEHLLAVASQLRGGFPNDVPKSLFWRSYILAAWDTGMRSCDILLVEHSWIRPDGSFTIVQKKTGHRHRVQFLPATLAVVNESVAYLPRKLVWPRWGNRDTFCRAAAKLLDRAGLDGTLKWLRRASATEVEKHNPGCAGRHLGHKTAGLAEKSYIDFDQLNIARPQPAPLAMPKGGVA